MKNVIVKIGYSNRGRIASFLVMALFLLITASVSKASQLIHPGHFCNLEELNAIKQRVRSQKQPQKSAYDRLLKSSYGNKEFKPRAQATVHVGYHNKPNNGGAQLQGDAQKVYAYSLLWFISGEQVYAENAMKILDDWAGTLREVTGNNKDLVIGWAVSPFMRGCEILKHTYPDWDVNVEKRFMSMVDEIFMPTLLVRIEHQSNWMSTITESLMATAIFKDDRQLYELSLQRYNIYLPCIIPFEDGRPLEIMRDLQHTQMGLGSLVQIAEMAWTQGSDVYSLLDSRLAQSLEYVAAPLDTRSGNYKQNEPIDSAWEMAYNHYHNRMGRVMPYTKKIVNKLRPDLINSQWGLGTLLKGEMDASGPLRIYSWDLPEAYNGLPYSFKLKSYNGTAPIVWSIRSGKLPDSLSLNSGLLHSDTVTLSAGLHLLNLTATDQKGLSVEQTFLLPVKNLREPDNPKNIKPGLWYEYASDVFSSNPGVLGSVGEKQGDTDYFNFSVAGQDKQYGLRFSGYLDVPADGIYTFYLGTENQSALYIGSEVLIEDFLNDCRARMVWEDIGYPIGLKAGKHAFCIVVNNGNYKKPYIFEDYGSMEGHFHVHWKRPGQKVPSVAIPASAFFHSGRVSQVTKGTTQIK